MNERAFYGEFSNGYDPLVRSLLTAVAEKPLGYVLDSLAAAYAVLDATQSLQLGAGTFIVGFLPTERN